MEAPVLEELPFLLASKLPVTSTIVELELRPLERPLRYQPGQYVLLGDSKGAIPQRSFSVANAPRADHSIRLLVTRVDGGQTSSWVHDTLRAGEVVTVSGPYGTFTQELPLLRPVLHLGAGSGLAPLIALTEAALRRDAKSRIRLLFSARTGADVYKRDVFAAWEARHPDFRFVRTLTREPGAPPLGRIPTLLPSLFADLSGHDVFIAGSGGFVEACEQAVIGLMAPRARVHTEPFFAEPRPWTRPAEAERRPAIA